MTTNEIRRRVADLYDGPAWKQRVSRMPDNQVYAIYRSAEKRKLSTPIKHEPQPHQINIWEWAAENERRNRT